MNSTAVVLGLKPPVALVLTATRCASGCAESVVPIMCAMLDALLNRHSRMDPLALSQGAYLALMRLADALGRGNLV